MFTLAIPLSFWVGLILTVMLVVCAFIEVHRDSSIDRILSLWRNKWENKNVSTIKRSMVTNH